MNDIHSLERRITIRLIAYWEKKRFSKLMPSEQDIDPEEIGDLWDNCFLIHVSDLGKPDYNYTYLGKAIAAAYSGGLPESDTEGMVSLSARKLASSYDRLINNPRPLIEEGEFVNLHNDLVKYRQCLLPLGENGRVDAIFGGMRFKIFNR